MRGVSVGGLTLIVSSNIISNRLKEVICMVNYFEEFLSKPHWTKAIFKHNNIPISAVAKGLGLSYSYVSNLLCGVMTITPEVEKRLAKLVEGLERSHSAPPAEDQ